MTIDPAKFRHVLAIESSCDETAVAIVQDGRRVLSGCIISQAQVHAAYGGVVPEIASRAHVSAVDPLMTQALEEAQLDWKDIDAVAVTNGPGLVGALLVGVSAAKALAYALGVPLVGVHHIEGHISANYIAHPELEPPFCALIASGGHTHLAEVLDYGVYRLLGCTRDDAAGEAFDKAAKLLGLPYPGGPSIEKAAQGGDPAAFPFPRAMRRAGCDFSFSGLKTAMWQQVQAFKGETLPVADLAASFQQAVVDTLVEKTILAMRTTGHTRVALCGGVASNTCLRRALQKKCDEHGFTLYVPPARLCTDNAEMIGAAGYYRLQKGERAGLDLNAVPHSPLPGLTD